MKPELQQQLYEKYPKIFRQKDLPPNQSLLCFGLEVGDGWFHLIDALCDKIQYHIDEPVQRKCKGQWWKDIINGYLFKIRGSLLNYKWNLCMKHLGRENNEPYQKFITHEESQNMLPFINLVEALADLVPHIDIDYEDIPVPQVEAVQVKQKYGSLRWYFTGGDERIMEWISMTETISGYTCEECGKPGKQNERGWITTLCDECRETEEKRRSERITERCEAKGVKVDEGNQEFID